MLRLFETFSGIGSQVQALKNAEIPHSVEAICEWEVGAMYAYDILHHGEQFLQDFRHHTRDSILEELSKYNLSGDGKNPMSERAMSNMSMIQMKALLHSILTSNNMVDITSVKADEVPDDVNVLTYSFPCQDLSISGHWHHNEGGIDKGANNRSTLLWQIERILKEYCKLGKPLPRFLLMENVSNILSDKHIGNFNEWRGFLEKLGYINQTCTLDARNFGVPQSRVRTYMVSVRVDNEAEVDYVERYFFENNLEQVRLEKDRIKKLGDYLRLDYSQELYRQEAVESTPIFTPSRQKIYEQSICLATDDIPNNTMFARTVTTKQDRNPNSGIIHYEKNILTDTNKKYRNLTPRECFLLMGFSEKAYDRLISNNIQVGSNRAILSNSKLIRLAGNSIVVQVLESVFKQINEINEFFEAAEKEADLPVLLRA